MKQDVTCNICERVIGHVYGKDISELRYMHIKRSHPDIFTRIQEIKKSVDMLQLELKDYKVSIRDLFWYNK